MMFHALYMVILFIPIVITPHCIESASLSKISNNIDVTSIDASSLQSGRKSLRRLGAEGCKDEIFMEGMFSSIFVTIAALTLMDKHKDHFGYYFDFCIGSGTLVAHQRNEKMFAWDSDGDMYITFKDNLNQTELEKWRMDLSNVIEYILDENNKNKLENDGAISIASSDLPKPVDISTVVQLGKQQTFIDTGNADNIQNSQNCDNKRCITWRTINTYRAPPEKPAIYHSLHIEMLAETNAFLDVFTLYYNQDKTKIRNDHCCSGIYSQWQNASILWPSDKSQTWKYYDNINVRIPNQAHKALTYDYGNWSKPDHPELQTQCQNVQDDVINEWTKKKYKTIFDIIRTDIKKYRRLIAKRTAYS